MRVIESGIEREGVRERKIEREKRGGDTESERNSERERNRDI